MQLFGVTIENIVSQQCNLFPFNTSHFAFIQSTKLLQDDDDIVPISDQEEE